MSVSVFTRYNRAAVPPRALSSRNHPSTPSNRTLAGVAGAATRDDCGANRFVFALCLDGEDDGEGGGARCDDAVVSDFPMDAREF